MKRKSAQIGAVDGISWDKTRSSSRSFHFTNTTFQLFITNLPHGVDTNSTPLRHLSSNTASP